MISRCGDRKNPDFSRYGGRGLRVARAWRADFVAFLRDMGRAPSPRHTLERMNNELGYRPGNCRWATLKEQANNRRSTVRVTIDGQTKTATEWATIAGYDRSVLYARIRMGWPASRLLTSVRPMRSRAKRPHARVSGDGR